MVMLLSGGNGGTYRENSKLVQLDAFLSEAVILISGRKVKISLTGGVQGNAILGTFMLFWKSRQLTASKADFCRKVGL